MRKVGFLYDDVFLRHETPEGHPECKERLVSILSALKGSDVWGSLTHIKPVRAALEDIGLVHTQKYIDKIKGFTGYADPDTYVSGQSVEAALFAAGAVIEAAVRMKAGEIERAFCAVRPPGHHAEAGKAMGFCIFNNVAVGARYARRLGYGKVFIIDFDVHHGNGTQHIFEEDPTVFYFSTHQYPHYPGTGGEGERGRGNVFNIPMLYGAGDKEYEKAYGETLPALMRDFAPDIVLVSAGYDMHAKDPLSGIRVSDAGVESIVGGILSASSGLPVVFCLEGGYDLKALSGSVLITIRRLLKD